MKPILSQQEYQALELIHSPSRRFSWRRLSLDLRWKTLLETLMQALLQKSEIKIWQHFDRLGTLYWNAYNPATKRSIYGVSESEIRIWVEQQITRG